MKCMSTQPIVAPSKTDDFMPLHGIDHVEFYVGNALQAASFWVRALGFKEVAYAGLETGVRDRASHVLAQGRIRIVLTGALVPDHEIGAHVAKHGDGVKVIALGVPDVDHAYREATTRGATGVEEPHDVSDEHGTLRRASIKTYGDTLHTFIDRSNYKGPFLPGYAPRDDRAPATPACSRSTTSSATSSSATWTSGSSTTRTSSGCARCCTSPTTTSRPSTPR